jgi:hypothetical protein
MYSTCFQCDEKKHVDEMAWTLHDNRDRGRCLKCEAIVKKKDELENESEYKGEPMEGFPSILMYRRQKIVCPHCGHVETPDWESSELFQPTDMGEEERDCENCEQSYLYSVDVKFLYTTKKKVSWEEAVQALAAEEG